MKCWKCDSKIEIEDVIKDGYWVEFRANEEIGNERYYHRKCVEVKND